MYSVLLNQFCKNRNLKESTCNGYLVAIKSYTKYHHKTIEDLISEATLEENSETPLKKRKIRNRLISYRTFLIESGKSENTIRGYFTKVKSFYRHYEITLPKLPEVKYNKEYETNYYDLPTREHIRRALDISSTELKAIILFMSSSGTARAETLSLTVDDFIIGCRDYYKESDLQGILISLSKKDNIVPTLYVHRLKTDKYYYTFCSPEASSMIIRYLMTRQDLKLTDPLFDIPASTLLARFQEINDYYNWGFKGKYRFFRSHVLRKFHASNIGLREEYIDALQGRSKNQVHRAYIKMNPVRLKEIYMKVMRNVTIGHSDRDVVNQEFNIIINVFLSGKEYNIY